MSADAFARALARPGASAAPYTDPANPDRPLAVHCYRASGYTPTRPVVLVQHGMLRNGNEYRDFWIPAAERHGLLIVAITFGVADWPTAEDYNNGRVFDATGALRPRTAWGYAIPARVFAALREAGLSSVAQAHLFGHSAGGQFVHRLLATQAPAPFVAAIAANPGWYSLPAFGLPFPEGLGGIGLGTSELAAFLAYPLTILAGEADTETDGPSVPRNPGALRQGLHRFARAAHFFACGREAAARLGLPFGWVLRPVAGIGHDGAAMSRAAAALWFEGRLPDAAELAGEAPDRVAEAIRRS